MPIPALFAVIALWVLTGFMLAHSVPLALMVGAGALLFTALVVD